MPSKEFQAYADRLAQAPPPPDDLQERRARMEAAMGQIPLAEGVTAEVVDAGGVPAVVCTPAEPAATLLYFHGGGYRMGSATVYRAYGSHLATATGARTVVVDYRLAPEHPFPAAVDDAVAAYRWLLDQGTPPASIVIGGDSAGGGLTAALLLAAREKGLPLPAGGVCLSPWVDLRNQAPTYIANAETDRMFSKASADEAAGLYLGDQDPAQPLASPVLGDWHGMPPLLIQVGGIEVLLDDAHALANVAGTAGVDVDLHVYDEMPHVWQMGYPAFPEAVEAVDEIAAFVRRVTS